MHRRPAALLPWLVLPGLMLVVAARLVMQPGALLVDADRPSIDHAMRAGGRPPGNDLTWLYLPHHARIADQLARLGRVPAWDPAGFGGRPRVGNPQAGLFYPPTWLAWSSRRPDMLTWLTIAHLIWGGLGVFTLSRRFLTSQWASVVAAASFQASPYVLAQAFEGHSPHVWAASWYPWAFWAAARMEAGERGGFWILPVVLSLAFVAGHPQEWCALLLALGGWAAALAVGRIVRREFRAALAGVARWLAVLAFHAGLVAVQWVPDLAADRWAFRGAVSTEDLDSYTLQALNLLQLLSPRALGGPHDFFGRDNYWETVLGFGWVPLVLILLALRRSPRRRLVLGWATLAAAALAFGAGRKLGLYAGVVDLLPGLDRFRVPSRSLFLVALAGSQLAGLGVETVAREDARGWGRRFAAMIGLILLAMIGGRLVSWRIPPPYGHLDYDRLVMAGDRLARDPIFWGAAIGAGVAIGWLGRRPSDRSRLAIALGVLALVELGLHGAWLWRAAPAERFLGPDPIGAAIDRLRPAGPFRIRAHDAFYDDLHALVADGLEKANLYDAFQVGHAADLYRTLYPIFDPPRTFHPDTPEDRAIRQAVLDRMNVAFLVSDRPEPDAPWPVAASGTWRDRPFLIYRNPTALPRAYVVPRARVAPDGPSIVALFPEVPPREAVILPADPLPPGGPRQPFTPAEYEADDPDRVEVRVATGAPGLLVVADTWMPGWSASLDGRAVPILRGDRAHRVVAIPNAGRHHVVMTYRPPGLAVGAIVTATTAAAWLLGFPIGRFTTEARRKDREKGKYLT